MHPDADARGAAHAAPPAPQRVGALWAGILVPPLAALAMLAADYAIVPWACARTDHVVARTSLHVIPLVMLVVTAVVGAVAWRHRRREAPSARGAPPASRIDFLALVAAGMSTLFLLVIVAQWLANVFYNPCVHA